MNDNIYSAKDMITQTVSSLFKNISAEKMNQTKDMLKQWKSILLSIKSSVTPDCGQKMLDHSRIIDIKEGVMFIEIDHPGWMQLFETYRTYILRGLEFKLPEFKINTLTYKLKKKEDLNTARIITREEAEAALEKQERKIEETQTQTSNSKLPPELEAIFSRFKETILTNDRKI